MGPTVQELAHPEGRLVQLDPSVVCPAQNNQLQAARRGQTAGSRTCQSVSLFGTNVPVWVGWVRHVFVSVDPPELGIVCNVVLGSDHVRVGRVHLKEEDSQSQSRYILRDGMGGRPEED